MAGPAGGAPSSGATRSTALTSATSTRFPARAASSASAAATVDFPVPPFPVTTTRRRSSWSAGGTLDKLEGEGDKSTMLFDGVLKHPVLKQVLAASEEQATKAVGKLLADERVTHGLQELLAAAAAARATVESGVQAALHAANLPTADELRTMRQRLGELEAQVEALRTRLGQEAPAEPVAPPPPSPAETSE